ncbi:hypothetical protein [Paraburkholderia rhynchosiae]|uniref:Uncharacterized protein n=1 Tax=Paraburkholderia rhynchosiae TaxID=487049 RepID=A0A2N7W7V8_9BURK|nr:hypothetical protein [Paraburkholderia rhynchosiae]PMS25493.1 hypothetical protein C0Z16_29270 [Paraburkholderia rhynchosiae]CAB3733893.1 hypothetical protein LMG27174_06065 [Paraburkholderia rhynchosiae]
MRSKDLAASAAGHDDQSDKPRPGTSYIPMPLRFVYLTAVVDWGSRKLPAHRLMQRISELRNSSTKF